MSWCLSSFFYEETDTQRNKELCPVSQSYLVTVPYYLEKVMATHSSTLAWEIPWMEEPARLQSMGSLRVGHNWVTSLSRSCTGEGNGNPLQCSCLENPRGGGAWWAAVYGVAQSWTRLKRLSSSSNSRITRVCHKGPLTVIVTAIFYTSIANQVENVSSIKNHIPEFGPYPPT